MAAAQRYIRIASGLALMESDQAPITKPSRMDCDFVTSCPRYPKETTVWFYPPNPCPTKAFQSKIAEPGCNLNELISERKPAFCTGLPLSCDQSGLLSRFFSDTQQIPYLKVVAVSYTTTET